MEAAFLLAPRPTLPPKVLVAAGICGPREVWRVRKAFYGFQSSPARWAQRGDLTLKGFHWEKDGNTFALEATPEVNLWKITKWNDKGCVGHVVVDVDDLMVLGDPATREGFLERPQQEWQVSTPEHVNDQQRVRFAWLEFKRGRDQGLRIGQPSYVKDLLERYGPKGRRFNPMPRLEVPEVEQGTKAKDVRKAQQVTGELLWRV